MTSTDWSAWHADYADPHSALSRRLRIVQRHIDGWLDATAPRPVTVVSACAGDGRDLLEVLERRADAERVTATLIEADAGLAEAARAHVARLGLAAEVRCGDAGAAATYAGAVPADLVLLCGVFGNISDDDVHTTVRASPQLCLPGALLVWTRHRRPPDLTPRIRALFADAGFEEVDFTAPDDVRFSVGVHRLAGEPQPLDASRHLFTFVK